MFDGNMGLGRNIKTFGNILISIAHPVLTIASFPGSPSFRAIIPRLTVDPPEGKAEGEPGRFCHMTRVMPRHRVYVSVLCVL